MVVTLRGLAWLSVALGIIHYRSGALLKNVILFKTPLPVGYYAEGNYQTDCAPLGPGDAPNHLSSLAYCEDEAFWEHRDASGKVAQRLLLLSCDPNRKAWNTVMGPLANPDPKGALWIHDVGKDGAKPQRITLKGYPENHDFHPLGVEAWPSYAGNSSNVYVVNHARAKTVIEQFTISPADPTTATYIRTLSSPYFVAPNALALTSPDSFYVTNDHLITRRWPIIGHIVPILESILALPLAFVAHVTLNPPNANLSGHDAIAEHKFVAKFIPFPNGVALSADGKTVAVASTTMAHVRFYDRDPATNALTRRGDETVFFPFTPDNIRFIEGLNGAPEELIVSGHPHFPSLTKLAASKPADAGSWVVSLSPTDKKVADGSNDKRFDLEAEVPLSNYVGPCTGWTARTLFQSDGSAKGFASSTTGLRDPESGKLFITGLYSPEGAIVCSPKK